MQPTPLREPVLREETDRLSVTLDIENHKNEYLSSELRDSLEKKVLAEIELEKLNSENLLLQEELSTNMIGL